MEEPPSLLHAAVQVADLIRTSILRSSETARAAANGDDTAAPLRHPSAATSDSASTSSSSWPPGIWDGIVAGGVVLAILTPVRTRLTKVAGTSLGMLPDLFLTSSQVVASGTAALYMGSLQGSRYYLKTMADADPSRDAWVPEVCSSQQVQNLLRETRQNRSGERQSDAMLGTIEFQVAGPTTDTILEQRDTYYFTQDPRRQTLDSLAKALDTCRRAHPSSVDSDWPS